MKVLSNEEKGNDSVKLDLRDKKILYLKSLNSRMSPSKISSIIGVSREGVNYRLKRFEDNHVLDGSRTIVNLRKFNCISYHVFLRLKSPSNEIEKQFVRNLEKNPNINSIIKYDGQFDFEISIQCKDPFEFDKIFKEILRSNPQIQHSEILCMLDTFRSDVLPKDLIEEFKFEYGKNDNSYFKDFKNVVQEYVCDPKDLIILKKLSNNSEASLSELSKSSNLSTDAVSYRIKKLISSGYILSFRPVVDFWALGYSIQSMLFKVRIGDEKLEKDFYNYLKSHPNILWGVNTVGGYDMIIYFISKNQNDFHKAMNEIRTNFGSIIRSYEILLAYRQYKYSFLAPAIIS